MDQKCDRLYPSAPLLENIDLEKQIEKKINDLNSFNNHVNNIKEMITYFKDKSNKSKKRYKNYKTLNTILKSVDSIVNFDNVIDYWCWFDYFTNISRYCLHFIIR